jgi:hypothetical protein
MLQDSIFDGKVLLTVLATPANRRQPPMSMPTAGVFRVIAICLVSLCILTGSESTDAKFKKIIAGVSSEEQKISESREQANQKAEEVYAQARMKMVASAIGALRKSLEGNDDPAFKVAVFKTIVNIDPSDEGALRFFKAVGNLEDILEEVAKDPILPPVRQKTVATWMRESVTIVAVELARMQKMFKLREPYLVMGTCLRLHNAGSITLQDTTTGSFTVRFSRGGLGGKLDDVVTSPFDGPRFLIRGNVILNSTHSELCRAAGVRLLEGLLVSFNAVNNAFAVLSDSGTVITEGVITPKAGTALFEVADRAGPAFGSRIASVTVSKTPHPLVMKK